MYNVIEKNLLVKHKEILVTHSALNCRVRTRKHVNSCQRIHEEFGFVQMRQKLTNISVLIHNDHGTVEKTPSVNEG